MNLRIMFIKVFLRMGMLAFLTNFFSSCSDTRSAFKPGFLAASGYYVRHDKVYYYGGFNNASVKELVGANAKSFEVLNEVVSDRESPSMFARDDKHIYYSGELLRGADSQTFTVLGSELGKDKNHVFSRTSVLSNDPRNFVELREGFYKDTKTVFMGDRIISDDPGNFSFLEIMDGVTYWSDSKGIIANDIRFDSADVVTFSILMYGYSLDKNRVYLIEESSLKVLADIDPKSFKVLSRYYTSDAKNVYWRGKVLPQSNPETFEILSEELHCSHDGEHAYHWNNIIPGADPATFPKNKICKSCSDASIVF